MAACRVLWANSASRTRGRTARTESPSGTATDLRHSRSTRPSPLSLTRILPQGRPRPRNGVVEPYRFGEARAATLADLYCTFGMTFLLCCYHQILGPRRHLPKLSNSLCSHAGAYVRLNPHLGWQSAESYVERINAFALIPRHGDLADCPVGHCERLLRKIMASLKA